ncbi:MAG: protein phosphatase 2C domain-containing protein [Actinobacteria bacterium]|nr:protein phosphatase 2C domain-containing protein [Actinomycetota bacterium]
MQTIFATAAGDPARTNEDIVVCGPNFVVMLDGATAPPGITSGCIHDVAWLVRHLAGHLGQLLTTNAGGDLRGQVADAITRLCADHADTCDLKNPASPSSTLAVLRECGDTVDALVLSDSPIVLNQPSGIRPIIDDRPARLPSYKPEDVRDQRNQPGGFWVASTEPQAAYEAIYETIPAKNLRQAAVLTDGAARLVERFRLTDWYGFFKLLDTAGPSELIRQVRAAERTITPPPGSRGKQYDDATAALADFAGPPHP